MVLSVVGVSHVFPGAVGDLSVLGDIDLEVRSGEFVAIVGPSGCGKTTLLNLMSGLDHPSVGSVELRGAPPVAGMPDLGYLFARDALLPWRTVLGNAELALELRGVGRAERRDAAARLLGQVGLAGFEDRYPAQLSQGMRQRVAIARTLVAHPSVLFLDEPFSALDAHTKLLLQETFSELWGGLGSTVVLITHDLGEAVAMADRVVLMTRRPGRIKRVVTVDIPRPRSPMALQDDAEYHRVFDQLWEELRQEVVESAEGILPAGSVEREGSPLWAQH